MLILVLFSGTFGLVGCSVNIKEEDFYSDLGPNGAMITHFYDTSVSYIGKAAWDEMREGYVCMSPDAIKDIEVEIEELCSKTSCTKETKAAVKSLFLRLKNK